HAEAKRLDPNITTSFLQTLLMNRDIDRLMAVESPENPAGADDIIRVIGLGLSGRHDEARQTLTQLSQQSRIQTFHAWISHLKAWLDRRIEDMLSSLSSFQSLTIFDDPEAIFQEGWFFCDAGDHPHGLEFLQRAVARGYFAATTLARSPHFDPIRSL